MTTLTNNLNEQLFTELAPAEAEVIQGGWDFEGYDGFDLRGSRLAAANYRIPSLKYPNRISSIKINSGVWAIYDEPNYQGFLNYIGLVGRGTYNLSYSNNRIESLKQIA